MNGGPTTVEKLRGLRWSIASNAANTVFSQFTVFGSPFVLLLSALGLSKSQMGFLLSLMPFASLIALFIAPAVDRFGQKRTYLTFMGARKAATTLLLLTPLVASQFGSQTTLLFVAGVITVFSIVRAIAFTGYFPWVREFVPDTVRGKYTAMNNIFTALTGFVAVSFAGYILDHTTGLWGYMLIMAIGVLFGVVVIWTAAFIPGGAPTTAADDKSTPKRNLAEVVRDRDFMRYLAGLSLITLATVPLSSFLPLFMQEEVGLSSGNVVMLQTGTLLGGLLWSYVWGWAADRYGSKPVTLWGLSLSLLLPILWLMMPRQGGDLSLYAAFGISFLQGVADLGWAIGSARLLYVGIVPAEKKSDYMALYYAWSGIAGGLSRLIGGWALDASHGISGQVWLFSLDPYLPLFAAGLILPLISIWVLRRIRADETLGMGEFAGIFFRGNPFLAVSSMVRYHLARDERATVRVTERLGQARSPLTVEELLEALADPRFNVRFEAIVAMSRMPPDPRLTDALIGLLNGTELALAVVAAWALGRMGDQRAIEPLRAGLDSPYHSIRAHCARALGALRATEIIPLLSQRLADESDKGLQMAYASALGNLKAGETVSQLLSLLRSFENEGARMELALSLARMVGDEHHFVQLVRHARADPGTTTAQAIAVLSKKVHGSQPDGEGLITAMDECAQVFAREDMAHGAALLSRIIGTLPLKHYGESSQMILEDCAKFLDEFGARHMEYVLLAIHTMDIGWRP